VGIIETPGGTLALGPMALHIKFTVAVGWRKTRIILKANSKAVLNSAHIICLPAKVLRLLNR
jgi:hypothetical protein